MATIERHRTAMRRTLLSRPLQQAYDDDLLPAGGRILDYGCGHGGDVRFLRRLGFEATGWDPAHAPGGALEESEVVNLGYVVNVIEDRDERTDALRRAWKLATELLIVSARLVWDPDSSNGKPYGDGRLTSTGTFQKFYEPDELQAWITATLAHDVVTAAPGIYYAFRRPERAQALLARQQRSGRPRLAVAELLYRDNHALLSPIEDWVRTNGQLPRSADIPRGPDVIEAFGAISAAFGIIRRAAPDPAWDHVRSTQRRTSEQRFEEHLDDLQPLIDFLDDRGRLPRTGELLNEATLIEVFGSVRAAYSLVRRVTGPDRWREAEAVARDNFLVYAALAAFGGRPRFSELPDDLRFDAKDLFGGYSRACEQADDLLYSIANSDKLDEACKQAPVGKLTPEALYVHVSALATLPPILRVYQGAAQVLTGRVDDATVLKLHRQKAQVSFLSYPCFDKDPHPALEFSLVARLRERKVTYRDFSASDNPPILHRKESFVSSDHPLRGKFERLTAQEERHGLLDRPDIGRQVGWTDALREAGRELRGHRLVSRRA